CAAGIKPEKEGMQMLPFSAVPLWVQLIKTSSNIIIPSVEDLPEEWRAEKKLFQDQAIQSLAAVPMVHEKTVVGFVGFDSVLNKRTWKEEEITLLRVLTDLLAVAFQRKSADEALRLEKKRFQILIQHAPFGLLLINSEGEFTYANQRFTEIFGYDLADVPNGKTWFKKAYPDPSVRVDAISAWVNDLNTYGVGEKRPRTFEVQCKNGRRKIINFIPVGLETGENLVAFEDITDRSSLEERVRQTQKMESIGTLAGGIAHDFNNLLQAMGGYIDLLLLEKNSEHQDWPKLKAMRKAVDRAAQLIRQLLLFSRKAHAERRIVDLNQEVEQAVRILERTIPKMIKIELHPGRGLWAVNADPVQIEQMLLNLGSNASDAMPEGGKLIVETENATLGREYAETQAVSIPGMYVLLKVSDTGCGMDRETVKHIFEPFFTTKEVGKGTGLGLASVYGIVKGHGGYITCYSEQGQGTIFKIYLPALDKNVADKGEGEEFDQPEGGTETILVVDDESDIRDMLGEFLRHFGYHTLKAASGEDALEIYKARNFAVDLVILDLNMPGMGGRRCLDGLLSINPKVRVLIASGYSERGQAREAVSSMAAGFIGKPFQLNELLGKIRDLLDRI
ncbi:MAG: response regulator, partial [Desulfobacteraceae bacterium]